MQALTCIATPPAHPLCLPPPGLDVDALRDVAAAVNGLRVQQPGMALLIITHYKARPLFLLSSFAERMGVNFKEGQAPPSAPVAQAWALRSCACRPPRPRRLPAAPPARSACWSSCLRTASTSWRMGAS